jgi:hypothetical protein
MMNQLVVNNLLFDHVYLDSNEQITQTGMANRYAAGTEIFAPYQFSRKDGNLWFKAYGTFERLSMTQNLNVNNNAYGTIVGADFPVHDFENGWKFLPTVYGAYNGGHQTYNGGSGHGVSMFQNGGQGGFMGSFSKGGYIGSILAYGGGYNNEMSLEGHNEQTNNWFVGGAVKNAYNFHPTRNFIIQPNLLASYNLFGKQNWFSNYGALSMNTGMLNGINVAPGLNLVYGKETWSVYLTTMYMYNINDQIGQKAGDFSVPSVKMRHGYLEYGIGATKSFNDRFFGSGQITLRNGGRTGVAFNVGLNYRF